jgi:hypothetical protein
VRPPVAERAYFAGLLDGEGSVLARRTKGPKGGFEYLVTLANTDENMVRWIADRWGGTVYTYPPRAANHRQQWTWRAYGRFAVAALEDALPYLITKKEHAELALSLARSVRATGYGGYTDEERAAKMAIIGRIAVLNRRGAA